MTLYVSLHELNPALDPAVTRLSTGTLTFRLAATDGSQVDVYVSAEHAIQAAKFFGQIGALLVSPDKQRVAPHVEMVTTRPESSDG